MASTTPAAPGAEAFESARRLFMEGLAALQANRLEDAERAFLASLENCRYEVNEAESVMRREGIAWLSSTHKSIEEIATTILRDIRPDRLMY